MAYTFYPDPIRSPTRLHVTAYTKELEYRIVVFGLTSTSYPDQFNEAILAIGVTTGTPYNYGGIVYVEEIEAAPYTDGYTDGVIVSYVMRQRPVDRFVIQSSAQQTETCYDVNGRLMKVTYEGQHQHKTPQKYVPQCTKSITRLENIPGAVLQNRAMTWVGAMDQSKTWLCTSMDAQSNDGYTWETNYSFTYNPDTWDVTIFFTDDSGQLPGDYNGGGRQDATGEDTIKTKQLYRIANFGDITP